MAGIYAITGAYIAYTLFAFHPTTIADNGEVDIYKIIFLAVVVLVLSVGTAIFLSVRNADKKGEKVWNSVSRRLVYSMLVPLVTGGVLLLILVNYNLNGLLAPFTLMFYGLALFNAGTYTYPEVKSLGVINIILGLTGAWIIEWGLLLWAIGFGLFHIIYGIYMHYKYER